MKQQQFYNSTAWKYFSRYVLTYYAQDNGVVKCSTCGSYKMVTDKLMQCGHYIKSTHRATCLDFENCLPQCYKCNRHFSGKPDVMRMRLIELFGKDVIEKLEIKKNNTCHLTKVVLTELRKIWRQRYLDLLKERNIKDFWK